LSGQQNNFLKKVTFFQNQVEILRQKNPKNGHFLKKMTFFDFFLFKMTNFSPQISLKDQFWSNK